MDLKEQLEGLKSDLMEGFEKKSQLDIQNAITAFEEKSKGVYEKEINEVKSLFQEKSKDLEVMQKHLDALDVRLQKANGANPNEIKTFNQVLGETIKENAEAIKNFKQGDNLVLEMKAVGDMSIAANFPGSTPFNQEVRNQLIRNPYDRVWLADLLPQGTTTK